MTIADELRQLQELHDRGELTDAQYEQAKEVVLNRTPMAPNSDDDFRVDADEVLTSQSMRTMQIIAAALLMGVLVFFGIVVVRAPQNAPAAQQGDMWIVSLVALMMLATTAPMSFIVPSIMTRAGLRQIAAGTFKIPPGGNPGQFATAGAKLMVVRQTTMIVGLALLEGTAFLGCIAYMMHPNALAFGIVTIAVILMVANFPSARKTRSWLERQAIALAELRQ